MLAPESFVTQPWLFGGVLVLASFVAVVSALALCSSCKKQKDPVLTQHISVTADVDKAENGIAGPTGSRRDIRDSASSDRPTSWDTTNPTPNGSTAPVVPTAPRPTSADKDSPSSHSTTEEKSTLSADTSALPLAAEPRESRRASGAEEVSNHYMEIESIAPLPQAAPTNPVMQPKDSRSLSKKMADGLRLGKHKKSKEEKSPKERGSRKASKGQGQQSERKSPESAHKSQRPNSITAAEGLTVGAGDGPAGSSISSNRAQSGRLPGRQLPDLPPSALPPLPPVPVPPAPSSSGAAALTPSGANPACKEDDYDHINLNVKPTAEKELRDAHHHHQQHQQPHSGPQATSSATARKRISMEGDYATVGSAGSIGVGGTLSVLSALGRPPGEEDVYAEPDEDLTAGAAATNVPRRTNAALYEDADSLLYTTVGELDLPATGSTDERMSRSCDTSSSSVSMRRAAIGGALAIPDGGKVFRPGSVVNAASHGYAVVKKNRSSLPPGALASLSLEGQGDSASGTTPVSSQSEEGRRPSSGGSDRAGSTDRDTANQFVLSSQAEGDGAQAEEPVYAQAPELPARLYGSSDEEEGADGDSALRGEGAEVAAFDHVARGHGGHHLHEDMGGVRVEVDDYDEVTGDGLNALAIAPGSSNDSEPYDLMTVRKSRQLIEAEAREDLLYESMDGEDESGAAAPGQQATGASASPSANADGSPAVVVMVPQQESRPLDQLRREVTREHVYESADDPTGPANGQPRARQPHAYEEVHDFVSTRGSNTDNPAPESSTSTSRGVYNVIDKQSTTRLSSAALSDGSANQIVAALVPPGGAAPVGLHGIPRRPHDYQEIDDVRSDARQQSTPTLPASAQPPAVSDDDPAAGPEAQSSVIGHERSGTSDRSAGGLEDRVPDAGVNRCLEDSSQL